MKTRSAMFWILAWLIASSAGNSRAEREPSTAPAAATTTNLPAPVTERPNKLSRPKVTGGIVAEVAKMLEAGAEPAVVKAFVQNWSIPYQASADDILYLHEIGAPAEILTAFIERGGALRTQAVAAAKKTNAPTPTAAPTAPQQGQAPTVVYSNPTYVYPSYTYPSYPYSYSYAYAYTPPFYYSYSYFPSRYYWPSYRAYYPRYYSYHHYRPHFSGYAGRWGHGYPRHHGFSFSYRHCR